MKTTAKKTALAQAANPSGLNNAKKPCRQKPAKQTKPTTITDGQVCDEMLAPIRVWAHANHGSVKLIADRLTTKTGRNVMRQTVGRWIHKDPAKRQQPTYGFGILLAEAVQELQREFADRPLA